MEAKKPETVVLPNELRNPMFCKDKDDFVKFFFVLSGRFSKNFEIVDNNGNGMTTTKVTIESMRMLLHEYMALVLSGKMEPYLFDYASEEDKELCLKAFRDMCLDATGAMMESGVTMKEVNGKYQIDYDSLKQNGDMEFGNA